MSFRAASTNFAYFRDKLESCANEIIRIYAPNLILSELPPFAPLTMLHCLARGVAKSTTTT